MIGVGVGVTGVRSSGGAEVAFPLSLVGNGLEGWWRVADVDTVTVSGGMIEAVADQSGNGRDASQAWPTVRPEYDTGSFSRAAAAFGGGQLLEVPGGFTVAMPVDDYTIWAVFQADDLTGSRCIFDVASAGGYGLDIEAGTFSVIHKAVGTLNDGAADTGRHLLVVTRVSGSVRMYLDGVRVSVTSPTAGVNALSGASIIGALVSGFFLFSGWVFECGGVSRVLGGDAGIGNAATGELGDLAAYVTTFYD